MAKSTAKADSVSGTLEKQKGKNFIEEMILRFQRNRIDGKTMTVSSKIKKSNSLLNHAFQESNILKSPKLKSNHQLRRERLLRPSSLFVYPFGAFKNTY